MKNKDKKLTLIEHLAELRVRLMILIVVNLAAIIGCYLFVGDIVVYLLALAKNMSLVYLSPPELFLSYLQLSAIGGLVLMSPVTIFVVWGYVAPALYTKEKIAILLALVFGLVCFVGGAVFCYFTVLPITLEFFYRMQVPEVTATISFASFMDFVNSMLFSFGLVFEMPVLGGVLAAFGILKAKFLTKFRGHIIVVIFLVAAWITPPDVVSQVLLALPMVALFEVTVLICRMLEAGRRSKDA